MSKSCYHKTFGKLSRHANGTVCTHELNKHFGHGRVIIFIKNLFLNESKALKNIKQSVSAGIQIYFSFAVC